MDKLSFILQEGIIQRLGAIKKTELQFQMHYLICVIMTKQFGVTKHLDAIQF